MKKLTKTKVWGEILSIITDTVEANTEAFKKGKDEAFLEALTDALGASFKPAGGGKVSTKVLGDGRVYCNYFEQFLEPSEFKMKSSKKRDENGNRIKTYKANSMRAEEILKKLATLKGTTESLAMEYLRAGKINEEQFNGILDSLDEIMETTYESPSDVPAVPTIFKQAGVELS